MTPIHKEERKNNQKQLKRLHTTFILLLSIAFSFFVLTGITFNNPASRREIKSLHTSNQEHTARQISDYGNNPANRSLNDSSPNSDNENDRIYSLLLRSGMKVDDELRRKLPKWSSIERLYGTEPRIYGQETCQTFRSTVPNAKTWLAPAGMYNTGTNLVATLLSKNCYMPEQRKIRKRGFGMRWQVPWGKHSPVDMRLRHVAKSGGVGVVQTDGLPVVMIKDPYTWMGSICRHHYRAYWSRSSHCPNLVSDDGSNRPVQVVNKYTPTNEITYTSLVTFWNGWYEGYINATFPRLIVRYEDLLYRPEEMIKTICECAGGQLNDGPFEYLIEPAQKRTNGMVDSVIKYASDLYRKAGYMDRDLDYAIKELNSSIMQMFHYKH